MIGGNQLLLRQTLTLIRNTLGLESLILVLEWRHRNQTVYGETPGVGTLPISEQPKPTDLYTASHFMPHKMCKALFYCLRVSKLLLHVYHNICSVLLYNHNNCYYTLYLAGVLALPCYNCNIHVLCTGGYTRSEDRGLG